MRWPRFAHRFPRRLLGATDADLDRMAWMPSYRAPHPRELLDPEPFVLPTTVPELLLAVGAEDVVWAAGRPVGLSLSGRAFVSLGEALLRAVPVVAVRLVGVDPVRGELPGCRHLERLTRLDLSGCQLGADVVPLVGSPHLSRLESLDLSGNDLGDAEATALAASPHLRRLRSLTVAGNPRLLAAGLGRLRGRFGTLVL